MKRFLLYALIALGFAVAMTSCTKDEGGLNVSFIYGKWMLVTENGADKSAVKDYWVYNIDGTGKTWVESDGVTEEDAQPFTWTLVETDLRQIHIMVNGAQVPKGPYTVTELSSTIMKYHDNWTKREFRKQ